MARSRTGGLREGGAHFQGCGKTTTFLGTKGGWEAGSQAVPLLHLTAVQNDSWRLLHRHHGRADVAAAFQMQQHFIPLSYSLSRLSPFLLPHSLLIENCIFHLTLSFLLPGPTNNGRRSNKTWVVLKKEAPLMPGICLVSETDPPAVSQHAPVVKRLFSSLPAEAQLTTIWPTSGTIPTLANHIGFTSSAN